MPIETTASKSEAVARMKEQMSREESEEGRLKGAARRRCSVVECSMSKY